MEPDIQCQSDTPDCLVNSEWIKWAAERIEALEAALSDIAKDGCDYQCTCTELNPPQDEWCPPCKAMRALLPGRGDD